MVLGKGLAVYLREIALYCWFHGNLLLFEGTLWIEWSAVAWTWAYYHVWYTSWFISHISQSSCPKKICDSHKVFRYLFPLRFCRIHAYLLPHGNSPFFKFLWSFVAMLTYFLFLQLGTAYESGAFNSAPSPRLGEKKLEALWDSRIRIREKKNWDAWWTQKETRSLQSLCFFSISSAGIYTYICICLEKICIFSCLSTSLWDKMWGSLSKS